MPQQPFALKFAPGFQRDGTEFDGNAYLAGQWCRFNRNVPRKMGGYRALTQNMTAISRALHSQTQSGYSYITSGFNNGIETYQVDQFGITSAPTIRTPGGFISNPNNVWQLTSYYDTTSTLQQLLAFVAPALNDIAYGAAPGTLYAGPIYASTALTAVTVPGTDFTGGIAVTPPYTIGYGSNGFVCWSVPGKPLDFTNSGSGAARVTDQKIVRALPLRGGGSFSPSALLWSIDSVIRMYFVGQPEVFAFDTITAQSSILSHNAVAEVDGVFYWAAQDRFLKFNGVVQEVPNDKNINFFFDNLNRKFAQKAFTFKNPRWGEIWFCAPLFNASEPNWAVIYNYRENSWYDTPLPNGGRSFGIQNDIAAGMIMSGVQLFNNATYRLWQHEEGVDELDGSVTNAINSSVTTAVLSATNFQQPMDRSIHIDTLEPDFRQAGTMSVTPYTRGNPRGPWTAVPSVAISQPTVAAAAQQIPLRVSAMQIKLQFISNAAGGDYEFGKSIANISTDQGRRTQ